VLLKEISRSFLICLLARQRGRFTLHRGEFTKKSHSKTMLLFSRPFWPAFSSCYTFSLRKKYTLILED